MQKITFEPFETDPNRFYVWAGRTVIIAMLKREVTAGHLVMWRPYSGPQTAMNLYGTPREAIMADFAYRLEHTTEIEIPEP